MNNTAVLLLLFVAAGVLVLLGVGFARSRGRQPSARDTAVMAGMTGMASAFLLTIFLGAGPLMLLAAGAICLLIAAWIRSRQWTPLGALLIGGGLLLAAMHAFQLVNDLLDPAVTIPGWTPVPLALGVAALVLGTSVVLANRSAREALS